MISSMANVINELPHLLPNYLRLRILGNKECLKFGWRHCPVPSPHSRNLTLAIAIKIQAKVDIKLFLSCPVLLDFSFLFQILCTGLSEQTKFWSLLNPVSFKKNFFFFWHFAYHQRISQIFNENIKQVSCAALPNLMVLCKQYFAYLV